MGWDRLLDVAAEHQLLAALWSSLTARGVRPLPADVRHPDAPLALLEAAYRDNARRVDDLWSQLVLVLDVLDSAGIEGTPIKGAHWLLAGWQRDRASRVMVDIDILIPDVLAADALQALRAVGYGATPGAPSGGETLDHQMVALSAPARAGSVELHFAPIARSYARVLTAAEIQDQAGTVEAAGRPRRIPSATHAMVLLISHAQLQDADARLLRLPLRALRDLAALVDEGSAAADWDAVGRHFHRAGPHARLGLAGFVAAAADLFALDVPVETRGGATWLRAAHWAGRHPRAAEPLREVVCLPRGLSAERMRALYGATTPSALARARARHLITGAMRRVTA